MAFGLIKSHASPIAVDFGVCSLKVAQVESVENEQRLVAAAALETPPELLENDPERLTFQADSLPKLIRGAGFKGKRAQCAVSALGTIVQSVQVQKAPGVPLGDMVKEQLRQVTGQDPRSLIVRWREVGEVSRGGHKRTEVLCIAMPRELVVGHMKLLRASKLEPVGIHSEHMAAMRSFDSITRRAADAELTSLYVDLGYGTTNVMIAHGRELVFGKTLHIGGRHMDQEIARRANCSTADSRRRRREMTWTPCWSAARARAEKEMPVGVGAPSDAESDEAGAMATDRRGGAAEAQTETLAPPQTEHRESMADEHHPSEALEGLTEELGMCLRYYRALFPGRQIGRTVFVGGEARQLGLCKYVARALRLPAQVADPLTPLKHPSEKCVRGVDLSQPQPGWATPIGLCWCPTDL